MAKESRGAFQYLNYAASWQNPLASYGAWEMENRRRMTKKYDPRGLLRRQVVGRFKLFSTSAYS